MKQIIWIIGASNGIGLELAKLYLSDGHIVIISARNTAKVEALTLLKQTYEKSVHLFDIDVSNTKSVISTTQNVWNLYGGIDICIYNAGVYESMKLEQWKLEHFEAMNQVNYVGAVRILSEIIPLFVEQKKGHIAFNISISSYFGLPYGGGYSAPKAGLLNLCESIEPELEQKGIKLQVINHGFVKTRLTAKNEFEMPGLLEPEVAAQKIYHGIMKTDAFEIKFPWALTRFIQFLRIIPYKLAFKLTRKTLQ